MQVVGSSAFPGSGWRQGSSEAHVSGVVEAGSAVCIVHCTGGHHSGHICLWGHGAVGETDPEGLGWQLPVIVGTHKQI